MMTRVAILLLSFSWYINLFIFCRTSPSIHDSPMSHFADPSPLHQTSTTPRHLLADPEKTIESTISLLPEPPPLPLHPLLSPLPSSTPLTLPHPPSPLPPLPCIPTPSPPRISSQVRSFPSATPNRRTTHLPCGSCTGATVAETRGPRRLKSRYAYEEREAGGEGRENGMVDFSIGGEVVWGKDRDGDGRCIYEMFGWMGALVKRGRKLLGTTCESWCY